MKKRVTAIFDIGKTNKKFLLFNDHFEVEMEEVTELEETEDEDGFPCEEVDRLTSWIFAMLKKGIQDARFQTEGLNFSTYGASFVETDVKGRPVAPLYNYLKPFPEALSKEFYEKYGPKNKFMLETASPALGMLNSGLQLYWLKREKPAYFHQTRWALHLPQYCSYLVHGKPVAELTSIGCHTGLWDYERSCYHPWVTKEGIEVKFPEIVQASQTYATEVHHTNIQAGVGIHDSSASLVPYLKLMEEPFILVSTGTWSITLNPFNEEPLNEELLEKDCLNFLRYNGETVRASRLFLGNEHNLHVKKMEAFFHQQAGAFKSIKPDRDIMLRLSGKPEGFFTKHQAIVQGQILPDYAWEQFQSFEEAYHQLIFDLVKKQITSIHLALGSKPVKKIIVTGGFCDNALFLKLLAQQLPAMTLITSRLKRASAIGAGLILQQQIGEEVQKSLTDFNTCTPDPAWAFLNPS